MIGYVVASAVTFLVCLWTGYVIIQSQRRMEKRNVQTAYQAGVMEGLVWPHAVAEDSDLPYMRDEVDQSTARYFVNTLNEAYDRDPRAVLDLFNTKVPTNKAMIAHPTIPVAGAADDQVTLSAVGIVNGLLPIIRNRYRVAMSDTDFQKPFKVYDITQGQFLEDLDASARTDIPLRT